MCLAEPLLVAHLSPVSYAFSQGCMCVCGTMRQRAWRIHILEPRLICSSPLLNHPSLCQWFSGNTNWGKEMSYPHSYYDYWSAFEHHKHSGSGHFYYFFSLVGSNTEWDINVIKSLLLLSEVSALNVWGNRNIQSSSAIIIKRRAGHKNMIRDLR